MTDTYEYAHTRRSHESSQNRQLHTRHFARRDGFRPYADGMSYKLEKNIGGIHNDYDGNAPVYGIGLWFTIAGVGVRAEYEKIDIKELDDAQMVSVSLFYKF